MLERFGGAVRLVGALGLVVACGGNTDHNAKERTNPGGSSSVGGSPNASSGATSTGGATGAAGQGIMTSVDEFDTPDTHATLGLWMGFPTDMLPIDMPVPAHDGTALHLVGKAGPEGLDVFYHTPTALEKLYTGMRFWTMSGDTSAYLTVAVAGPQATYFDDLQQGLAWPAWFIPGSNTWQEVVVHFAELGLDAEHLSPHSEMFGAFHFIIQPNTAYDLWIDDLVGIGGPG